jgi:hypothetical protein
VGGFFSSLDSYDRLLYEAVQKQKSGDSSEASAVLDLVEADKRWSATLVALDNLLKTVPDDVMTRSKFILTSTYSKEQDPTDAGEPVDDEKLLKSLLY